jgi:hypothetical protein
VNYHRLLSVLLHSVINYPAQKTRVRAMRARQDGGCPPGRQARRPRQARTRPTRVGSPHGTNATQDSCRLRHPPRAHPRDTRHARGISHRKAGCPERRKSGLEGGCPEKAKVYLSEPRTSPDSPPCGESSGGRVSVVRPLLPGLLVHFRHVASVSESPLNHANITYRTR